jgi:hypothetical protein
MLKLAGLAIMADMTTDHHTKSSKTPPRKSISRRQKGIVLVSRVFKLNIKAG